MTHDGLLTPQEFVEHGSVTPEEMQTRLGDWESIVASFQETYPSATFTLDADNILRIEANEEEAREIDFCLQDRVSIWTPFVVTIRP